MEVYGKCARFNHRKATTMSCVHPNKNGQWLWDDKKSKYQAWTWSKTWLWLNRWTYKDYCKEVRLNDKQSTMAKWHIKKWINDQMLVTKPNLNKAISKFSSGFHLQLILHGTLETCNFQNWFFSESLLFLCFVFIFCRVLNICRNWNRKAWKSSADLERFQIRTEL